MARMKLYFTRSLDLHLRELIQRASQAFVMRSLGAGLEFGFSVLLARMLGAEGAGIFFLALTMMMIGTVLGRVGLDNAVLRFVAANASGSDWIAVKGVYRRAISVALPASAAAGVTIFLAGPWLAQSVFGKPELTSPLRWLALAVLPMSLVFLHAEMLKGLKRIIPSQLVYGVCVPGLSIIGLLAIGPSWGVDGAAGAYVLAAALTALGGFLAWRAATPQLNSIEGRFPIGDLMRTSLPLFWVKAMNLAMGWTSLLLLGILGTRADVGLFGVAHRTALVTSLVLIAVNSIAAPKFAELHKTGDVVGLASTARASARLMLLFASPIFLVFLLVPGWVMSLFGPDFAAAGVLLVILALGQLVNTATGSVGYLLMMSGNEVLMRNSMALAVTVNLGLNLVLIPATGAVGAAIATAGSVATLNLTALYFVVSRLGLRTLR